MLIAWPGWLDDDAEIVGIVLFRLFGRLVPVFRWREGELLVAVTAPDSLAP